MSDLDKINAFMKGFTDIEGALEVRAAVLTVGQKISVIPTGSALLDDALSSGGYPKGRIIQLYGRSGSGKTLMSMIAIKNAQKDDPSAKQIFIDAEGTFDSNWAETLGVDTAKVILIEGDLASNGRRLFEMLLGKPKEDQKHKLVGKSKPGLLDQVISGNININLFVLDSLGQIIPPGEDISEIGKMNISLLSRFLTPTFRKLSVEVKHANVPFIVINHARDNMDPYGADHTYAGGNTYSHSLSANIWFTAVGRKDAQIVDEKDEKIGHLMKARVEKSKFGPHPRDCEFAVDFNIGIVDQHKEVVELAIKYGVVDRPTTKTYTFNDLKWNGRNNLEDELKTNSELSNEIMLKTLKARDAIMEEKRFKQKEKITQAESPAIEVLPNEEELNDSVEDVSVEENSLKKRGRKPKEK
jgi:recombination protein RecA